MIDKYIVLIAFLKKQDEIDRKAFRDYHCIIHQKNLCAKTLRFDAVMEVLPTVVKFIREKALNHHQFQIFAKSEWEADHRNVICYCDVRWVSRAYLLKKIAGLKDPIQAFMTYKNKPILEFDDPQFVADFAFLTNIPSHVATVTLKRQLREQLINTLFSHVKAFQAKLTLFHYQLAKKDLSHFPVMTHMICKEYALKLVKCISELENTFNERFNDFRLLEQNINCVTPPLSLETDDASAELQLELIHFQCDELIKKKFDEISGHEFYRKYMSSEKFPKLKKNAVLIISLFGSTYVCEQMFSRMKHVKNKIRSSITDGHLEQCMQLATASLEADIYFLVREKQNQVAY